VHDKDVVVCGLLGYRCPNVWSAKGAHQCINAIYTARLVQLHERLHEQFHNFNSQMTSSLHSSLASFSENSLSQS
jgi:hypothetical protein